VLVGVAWLTREVQFVLNAAFSLRGLTSGALLGGIILALFARGVGARAAMLGMSASVLAMNLLYWPPNLTAWPGLRTWWLATFGGEIFWPWFTLIGTLITLGVAWATRRRGTNPGA
jgi:Na+/proline symporter